MNTNQKRQKSIFLAFAGDAINQSAAEIGIQDGYECWDLKKFTLDSFVSRLKEKIPPVNNNVLRHYELQKEGLDIYGISEQTFKDSSWGVLIPDCLDDAISSCYSETLFLLNLYSPAFLYPLFYATDFGITRPTRINRPVFTFAHYQNQSNIIASPEFVSFFKLLLPQSQYATWQLDRTQKWSEEDWRLFVAGHVYNGLTEYDNSKNSFGWQRESADMATILESLFTAHDSSNEEIGYRLRKRIAALLSHRFPEIEKDIKSLYKDRSSFVHGSFFSQISKDSKRAETGIPIPDFDRLYAQKEHVRWAFVAYLHLARKAAEDPAKFDGLTTVMDILERSIIDLQLRKKVIDEAEKAIALLPRFVSTLAGSFAPSK